MNWKTAIRASAWVANLRRRDLTSPCARDPATEIDFCASTFDAVERARRPGHDGTVAHALVTIGPAMIVLRRERWRRPLLGFVAVVIVFQILTLGQPSVLVGLALLLHVAGIL